MVLRTTGIDHINLHVKNLEETCQFWKTLLGFEVLEECAEFKGKIIGNAIVNHPDISAIVFTGSEKTAKLIQHNLSKSLHSYYGHKRDVTFWKCVDIF